MDIIREKVEEYVEEYIAMVADCEQNGILDPETLNLICTRILHSNVDEVGQLIVFLFIKNLLIRQFERKDFYQIFSDNGIRKWGETDKFKKMYATTYSIMFLQDARQKGVNENEIKNHLAEIEEIMSTQQLTELTETDYVRLTSLKESNYERRTEDWMIMSILPLLFTLQSEGAKEFLKKIFQSYEYKETRIEITKQIVETSIPEERKAEVSAEDLLNIYTKFSIIDEDLAFTIAKEVSYNPPTTLNTIYAMLKMALDFTNPIDNILEMANESGGIQLPEATQKLQFDFFDCLPKEVQEKIKGFPFFKRKFEKMSKPTGNE